MKIILFFFMLFLNLYAFTDEDRLQNYLYKKFISYYPTINIENINIKVNSKIPKNYKLERVYFPRNSIKRENGSFSAIYSDGSRQKRIYFKYNIKATVSVLIALDDIAPHTPLNSAMFSNTNISFTNFYDKPILNVEGKESKVFIPKGKILVSRIVRTIPAIHRGDVIQAVVRDGGVELYFEVKALQDGGIGETIRVKRDSYKILKARVISAGRVEIK